MSKNEWKLAAKWLYQCGCLPSSLTNHIVNDTLTLKTFAIELRTGIAICNLLNHLIPDAVNPSKISNYSKSSRVMSAYNIALFTDACNLFDLNQSINIDPDKLYDLDLSQILSAISLISISKASISKGYMGFYYDSEDCLKPDTGSDLALNNDKEIYAPATFFLNEKLNAYDKISEHYKSPASKASNFFDLSAQASIKKTDHILKELLVTEESYLNMLNSLQNDYLLPVSKVLNYGNYKCIGINIDILIKFHNLLYFKLLEACEGGQGNHFFDSLLNRLVETKGRTVRICNIFLSFKKQFVEKYSYYFENIDDALAKISTLSATDTAFKRLLDEGQLSNTFSLTDLLIQPFQRITKYHLFFKDIYAKSKASTETKDLFKRSWDAMEEICAYLNQCKKDQDNITKINFLTKTLASFKLKTDFNLKEFGRFLRDESIRKIKTTHLQEKDNGKKTIFLFEKAIIIISKSFNSYTYIDTLPIDDYLLSDNMAVSNLLFRNISIDSTTSSKASVTDSTNNCTLSLHNPNNDKSYMFYFKSVDQRNEWRDAFCLTRPDCLDRYGHKFTLKNFERNIVECSLCKKYLNGIFFQGYKCEYCLLVCHRECLEKAPACEASLTHYDENNKNNQNYYSIDPPLDKRKDRIISENVQQIRNSAPPKFNKMTPQNSKTAIYKAIKSCDPTTFSKTSVISFKVNDFICLQYEEDSEWTLGYQLIFGLRKNMSIYTKDIFRNEGYIPRGYLKQIDFLNDLEAYSWYLNCDKKTAVIILERIRLLTNTDVPFFMVRFRNEAGHAITVCFDGKIKHIRINSVVKLNGLQHTIDNNRYFDSIVELVDYYIETSLVQYFKDIDTSLGRPYREMLPEPLHKVVSRNEFVPPSEEENKNQEIRLHKGGLYFFLQEFEHWSYVFDENGLLGFVPKNMLVAV